MSQTRDINVVSTLIRKRDEIEGRIQAYREAIDQCQRDLAAVSATLSLFKSDGAIRPNMSLGRLFRRGEIFKIVTEAIQAAGKPLDTRELAVAVANVKGLDAGDRVIRRALATNIVQTLTMRAKRGQIARQGRRGGVVLWWSI